MLRFIKYLLVVALLFLSISYATSAQEPEPAPLAPTLPPAQPTIATPGPPASVGTPVSPCSTNTRAPGENEDTVVHGGKGFTTDPPVTLIDETTPCVEVTFYGLTKNRDYYLCTGDPACLEMKKVSGDSVITNRPSKSDSDGTVSFRVCGDEPGFVKVGDDECSPDNSKGHWFVGGNYYAFSVVSKINNSYQPLKPGGFFVQRYRVEVDIDPNTNLSPDTTNMNVTLYGLALPGGSKRNNYQIIVENPEGNDRGWCGYIGDTARFNNITSAGTYTILIKEQINEPITAGEAIKEGGGSFLDRINPINIVKDNIIGPFQDIANLLTHPKEIPLALAKQAISPITRPVTTLIGYVKTGIKTYRATNNTFFNTCQGGYINYEITCDVPNEGGGKCTRPEDGWDPEGEEYKAFLSAVARLNSTQGLSLSFPCGSGTETEAAMLGKCLSINSAIGPIDVVPERFIGRVFQYVLAIAGFGAIILIIYSGYLFMTSQGDKERIAGARETITSAIVGLLFIILSFIVLEIIGFDILRIPGFSR